MIIWMLVLYTFATPGHPASRGVLTTFASQAECQKTALMLQSFKAKPNMLVLCDKAVLGPKVAK